MKVVSESSLWGRLTVGRKLALIPALFIVAIAGILLYTIITAQDQKTDIYVLNMTARQRMLVNRQFAQLLLVSQGFEAPHELPASPGIDVFKNCLKNADYLATRRLAADTAESMLNGGPRRHLFYGVYPPAPAAPA